MKHTRYIEWLQLSYYDELFENEKRELEQHLATCEDCRRERNIIDRLWLLLAEYQILIPTERMIEEARQELAGLMRARRRARWNFWWEGWRGGFLRPAVAIPVSAVATLAIGLFIGYVLFPQPETATIPLDQNIESLVPVEREATQIADVQFIDSESKDGEIEFSFNFITPMRVRGNIEDPMIQKLLTHAIVNENNAGVRLRSLNALARQVNTEIEPDDAIMAALIKALESDPNTGVRKEALNLLQKFPADPLIKEALLNALSKDENAGIRIAAINGLEQMGLGGTLPSRHALEILRRKMASDPNNYVRYRAQAVLEEIQDR